VTTPAVLVTGMGVVTPFGPGVDRLWTGLVSGESRIAERDRFQLPSGPTLSAAMPDEFHAEIETRYGGRANAWAVETMLAETLGPSSAAPKLPGRGAVFFGNAFDGDAYADPDPKTREWRVDRWAAWLQERTGAETASCILTACTTANTAISLGADWIASGDCDWAIVGAMELLHPELLIEVDCLRMTSPTGCRPFSEDHDGTVLGDGAGLFLLESARHASERGVRGLVEVAGFGLATDGGLGKFTSDGSAVRGMMEQALTSAELPPSAIDFINSAGTGSAQVDDLDFTGIRALFGDLPPIVYSVKPLIGQSIGGTGAVEAVATILSLLRQEVPSSLTDPRGPRQAPGSPLDAALNNSIAMNGHMATTLFRRIPPRRVGT
jgi:3-oxoacyl-[acyl-carrier-protein] synthase II